MARLQKFNGADSLPGVGSPQVVADTAVGEAAAGLGQQIRRSAGAFGDLAETAAQRRRRIEDFQVQMAKREFDARLKERAAEEQRQAQPGGFGFTEAMMAHLEKSREQALKELPAGSRDAFNRHVEAQRDRYINGFAAIEAGENERYFQQGLEEEGIRLASEVRENPDGLEEAFEQARTLLSAAPLPTEGKKAAYAKISETLAEAWAETRPLEELLPAIGDELARREFAGPEGLGNELDQVGEAVNGPDGPEAFADESQVLAERLKLLPGETLGRMQVNAVKSRAAIAAGEVGKIERRIEASFGQFDKSEIEANGLLDPRQKTLLIGQLEVAKKEHIANIESANWLLSSEEGDRGPQRQKNADRAFTFLENGEIDRDTLALKIVETKGVVPESYSAALSKGTRSNEPEVILRAYENLTKVLALAPQSAVLAKRERNLVDRFEKWTLLTKGYGLSPEEAAETLAKGNDSGSARNLEEAFDRQFPDWEGKDLGSQTLRELLTPAVTRIPEGSGG